VVVQLAENKIEVGVVDGESVDVTVFPKTEWRGGALVVCVDVSDDDTTFFIRVGVVVGVDVNVSDLVELLLSLSRDVLLNVGEPVKVEDGKVPVGVNVSDIVRVEEVLVETARHVVEVEVVVEVNV
jgi:hypothetical protein